MQKVIMNTNRKFVIACPIHRDQSLPLLDEIYDVRVKWVNVNRPPQTLHQILQLAE